MKNEIKSGETLGVTAPYTVSSGGGMLVGAIFGVAIADVTSGAVGEIKTRGVFTLAKAAVDVAVGDRIYWDNANKVVTTVPAGNARIGLAVTAAASGVGTVQVLIGYAGASARVFQSTEQTGTGSAQNVAHGLGVVPSAVTVFPTDLAPATTGQYTVTLGAHTATNVVLTVTTGKKFVVVAHA